jgi:hypothetical protein
MLKTASWELPSPSFPVSLRERYERRIAEEGEEVEVNEDDSIEVRDSSSIFPLRFPKKAVIPGIYLRTLRKEVVGRLENQT